MAATPSSTPAAAAAAPAPPMPRSGDLTDQGAVVRGALRARSWALRGFGKVTGGLDLDLLTVEGDLAVAGPARVDRCESRGHVTIAEATQGTGPWTVRGELRVGAAISVGALTAEGRVDVLGPLTVAQALQGRGTLDVRGDVGAGSVRWQGATRIDGEVRAPSIELAVLGPSAVNILRGDRVQVTRRARPFASDPPVLEVLEIEAKEAVLSGVVAERVRADRVTIGRGCRLAAVDGTIVRRDASSVVGPSRRSHILKGLWR